MNVGFIPILSGVMAYKSSLGLLVRIESAVNQKLNTYEKEIASKLFIAPFRSTNPRLHRSKPG
jgi:hypothetical protein